MPSLKIKVPGSKSRETSQPEASSSRNSRKHRVSRNDEDRTGTHLRPGASERMSQPPDAENLFEDDVDVVGTGTEGAGTRSPSPGPSRAVKDPARKRHKKKTAVVYSDDEDDEYTNMDAKGRGARDNRGDDFTADSPPQRKRRGTVSARGRGGRGARDKDRGNGAGEVVMKDERKASVPAADAGKAGAGTKRRRETLSEAGGVAAAEAEAPGSAGPAQPAPVAAVPAAPQDDQPPPAKMRKLPTIKKNKSLVAPGAAASGPAPPSGAAAKPGGAGGTPSGAPLHVSLPRKPVAPVPKTADVDLFSPDIYASLFKGGASTPRAGINPRQVLRLVREEERRKELMKMRDEARAARMAELQKNSFDMLAGQEKVARFEAKLRARNSPALFPNHLGSAIKYIVAKKSAG
ncbi:hypothetical protein DFH11DRAFT_1541835 [Phellopilus nigrolimitatus]|nr:hypothetical protein DFH11DRAFT_1541835 [Phellopilus nigrolimitatus]